MDHHPATNREEWPRQRSYWLREALALPEFAGEACPPLSGPAEADVLIVGGGYTGMWTAYFLKEADPALDVVLVEQDICGGGPSGRNGGFVNTLWEDLEVLIELFGLERALEACKLADRSIAGIEDWCTEHGVDAWYSRVAHLGVSTSEAQDGSMDSWVEALTGLGIDDVALHQTPDEVSARCSSPVFRSGVLTPRTAMVQPARLARGLRRVLLEQGVRIYEDTPVRRFRAGPPAEAETPGGSVRASQAVLGINAWAHQWKEFRRLILPRASYIVLTAPAPELLADINWTEGEGIYDWRTTLHYLRTTPDGRIAFGAASSRAGIGTGMGPKLHYDDVSIQWITEDLWRLFPSFRHVPIEAAWGGPIDVSELHAPFFGTLPSGNVHYGLGFTGGGIGPCHMGGQILSGLARGIEDEYTRMPLVGVKPRKFPPEPLLSLGAFVTHEATLRKDDAEDEGRRANPLVRLLAGLPRKLGYHLGA